MMMPAVLSFTLQDYAAAVMDKKVGYFDLLSRGIDWVANYYAETNKKEVFISVTFQTRNKVYCHSVASTNPDKAHSN